RGRAIDVAGPVHGHAVERAGAVAVDAGLLLTEGVERGHAGVVRRGELPDRAAVVRRVLRGGAVDVAGRVDRQVQRVAAFVAGSVRRAEGPDLAVGVVVARLHQLEKTATLVVPDQVEHDARIGNGHRVDIGGLPDHFGLEFVPVL